MFSNQDLKRLILPLFVEQVLAIAVGMIDVMMVSYAGEAAVSGVSLVDMVAVVLINVFSALATGGAVVCAQYLGRRDRGLACRSAEQLLFISTAIGACIMAITLLLAAPIIRLFFGSIEADVFEAALVYFRITAVSYPFLAVYNAGAALYRAMGNSRISMLVSLVMNAVNIVLNALFIFLFHIPVAGVAVATLVSRVVAAAMMMRLLGDVRNPVCVRTLRGFRPDGEMIRRILHIGVPNGLENGLFELGRVLVVAIIATFGTTQIAANAVANTLDGLGTIPGKAVNLAMITVIGQCVGAGDAGQAKHYTKKLLKLSYLGTLAINAGILLLLPLILKAYGNLSSETLKLTRTLVWIHDGLAILMWPLSFTLPNALRAAGDVRFPMVVSIASMVVFRIVLSVVLGIGLGLGAVGVWIAMIVDWCCRIVCFVLRYRSGKWMGMRAI